MAETAAERRKRLKAAIDRAKANPNASDKGKAGDAAVKAEQRRVREAAAAKKKAQARSKKTSAGQSGQSSRNKKIDDAVNSMT